MIRIRERVTGDVGLCVGVLAEVYRTSGYPTNWPGIRLRGLRRLGLFARGWLAVTRFRSRGTWWCGSYPPALRDSLRRR